MCSQTCKVRIGPVSKPYHLSILSFGPWNLDQLQDVKSSVVKKECMVPKQFAELRDCRIIIGKHQCWKLRQGSAYLGFVQLHGLLLILSNAFCLHPPMWRRASSSNFKDAIPIR
jgi:hypothetical protein